MSKHTVVSDAQVYQTEPVCESSQDIALLRLPKVLALIPVSKSQWWAGVKDGRYPPPVKLSARCSAWKSSDIRALIASF